MGYIETSKVAEMRKLIKKAFPAFKFSITKEHHSTVNVRIMQGPVKFEGEDGKGNNLYHTDRIKDPVLKAMAIKIDQIVQSVDKPSYYETGDYGNQPSYYHYTYLGQWDKPYMSEAAND